MERWPWLDGTMIRFLLVVLGLAMAAESRADWTLSPIRELGTLKGGATAWERDATQGDRRVKISGVSFQERRATFQVIDNPPSARMPLVDALKATGAVAGMNGNYFHADDTPVGMTVSNGHTINQFERARLLSGIIFVQKGHIALVRSETLRPGSYEQALQCGPWLVEKGAPIVGLNAVRLARRSIVTMDGKGNWAIVTLSAATLAEAAEILTRPDFTGGWSVRNALNLDGGPSTCLVAISGDRTVIDIPSFGWVRNYLAIVPRAE
jgi:exopolysaccharide biosynthesis protein